MIFLNKTQLEKKTEKKRIMYTKISKWFDSDTFNLICVCIAWQNGEKKCNNLSWQYDDNRKYGIAIVQTMNTTKSIFLMPTKKIENYRRRKQRQMKWEWNENETIAGFYAKLIRFSIYFTKKIQLNKSQLNNNKFRESILFCVLFLLLLKFEDTFFYV